MSLIEQRTTPETRSTPQPLNDAVEPYKEALQEHFPSREDILLEAKAYSRRSNKAQTLAKVIAVFTIAFSVWEINPVLQSQEMSTLIGEHKSWSMADGSSITLNTNSNIKAQYRLHSREIELVKGEAMFRAAHGWRTFSVKTHEVFIRDIGTAFNVKNTLDGTEISVVEGKIEVATESNAQIITQNQRIASTKGKLGSIQAFNVSSITAWQNGKLMFDGVSLRDVVAELQRYRKAPIRVLDAKAGKLRISGEYDTQGIEALIDLLPSTIPVKIKRFENNEILISSR